MTVQRLLPKPTDWMKGIPQTLFSLRLPRGLHLDVSCGQHQSGKVSIHQSVGLTWATFNFRTFQIKQSEAVASTVTMDKLNEVLQNYVWLEASS